MWISMHYCYLAFLIFSVKASQVQESTLTRGISEFAKKIYEVIFEKKKSNNNRIIQFSFVRAFHFV